MSSDRTLDKLSLRNFFVFFEAFLPVDDDALAVVAGVDPDTLKRLKGTAISDTDNFYMVVPHCVMQACDVVSVAMMVCAMAMDRVDGVEHETLLQHTEQGRKIKVIDPLLSGDIKRMRNAVSDLAMAYGIDVAF